jgi:hypothetical protein
LHQRDPSQLSGSKNEDLSDVVQNTRESLRNLRPAAQKTAEERVRKLQHQRVSNYLKHSETYANKGTSTNDDIRDHGDQFSQNPPSHGVLNDDQSDLLNQPSLEKSLKNGKD